VQRYQQTFFPSRGTIPWPLTTCRGYIGFDKQGYISLLFRKTLMNVVVSTLRELLAKGGQTCIEICKERIYPFSSLQTPPQNAMLLCNLEKLISNLRVSSRDHAFTIRW
jgi:hypothetical protein